MQKMIKAACVLLTVLGAVAGTTPAAAQESGGELSFVDCGDGLRCAAMTVPSDWARPDSARITLGLAKLPARDDARKRGVLVINLGGPQAQISAFRQPGLRDRFAELTELFDVVLFDPRGFEASSGIVCPLPAPAEADYVFPDQVAYEAHADRNGRFGQECAPAAGPLAGKLNAWQVAHDLEAIRAALGERKLHYFGNSYGTVYAQAYLELFPRRAGRMYLDSVMDHTNTSLPDWLGQRAAANERSLHRFADWCARESNCALHGRDVLTVWDEVIDRAARQPIPAPGAGPGSTVSATQVVARADVKSARRWPAFAAALAEAHAGDATKLAQKLVFPPGPGAMRIATCADFPYPGDYHAVRTLETSLRAVAPRLGWRQAWIWAMNCARLPQAGTFPPHRPHFDGVPPVLIAGGEYDDNTPPEWGRHLAGQLPGARYLTAEGDHALYVDGNPCVRAHVHRYLTTGHLPPKNTTCAGALA
ncbi:alpha/beta hydrolase [Crossiella sp. SN42]|uniref:alpha/beta hydrolase n=1 Tax=Crossiella sp. SN42 TaxID=2944808 RepID=UPI00207C8368|nr:alpha/beta hydrolase [Crossiella sp. SN42]MCO1580300.1 alpha/beta hydrolase [Crossiella sp. SN42]